ncbi:Uracil-DNA glycosylase [Bernardetia litoralis DSM 6794]|uniref:Uracil-DNA glycosylase n=1 Tax=Bernardetia litoralis (strain ATCC 23117 / DSM 6794 / NBRC 15988 / NCIMB 1366 / Fx l1 / Sio-4) TaxID=880071 RepID=I4AH78_BERLS|nr:uracil-DNA glycosylase [Bernardetia litoralis]AFM03313.1 Uracil-DNA glycosylase [Bernardetia litoralis DSM 6794]
MDIKIAESWKSHVEEEFSKPYFEKLELFLREATQQQKIYPPKELIFNAFEKCSFEDTKVVILGQDPYHGAGQANGLSFSVSDGVRVPPSLKNIFKEINDDLGKEIPTNGNLERWASQGVLMLNAVLTVQASKPASHRTKGWENFTSAVLKLVSDEKENLVFLLWGKDAQKRGEIIDREKHLVLESPHPSPYSVHTGFFGNKHFSQANNYLKEKGKDEIDW